MYTIYIPNSATLSSSVSCHSVISQLSTAGRQSRQYTQDRTSVLSLCTISNQLYII